MMGWRDGGRFVLGFDGLDGLSQQASYSHLLGARCGRCEAESMVLWLGCGWLLDDDPNGNSGGFFGRLLQILRREGSAVLGEVKCSEVGNILVMSETAMSNGGRLEPFAFQETVFPSADKDSLPSCFLYEVAASMAKGSESRGGRQNSGGLLGEGVL